MLKNISRTVITLGLISLFTDISSEMIYPLLPVFLAHVLGAGAVSLGLIEGVAETTSATLKLASGYWADARGRRKPLIVWGYGLAGVARPLIGLAQSWPVVLGLRFIDRVGKGIRSAPRDALIADTTPVEAHGAAFGFHRALDHAGAVLGPLVAAALLTRIEMRQVFLWAALPAAIAFFLAAFVLKEPSCKPMTKARAARPLDEWRLLGRRMNVLLAVIFLFLLGNSTDAFLLVRLAENGASSSTVALLWSLHHVVKMVATFYGGRLTDRMGARWMMTLGWGFYALVYLGFACSNQLETTVVLFLVYGVYFGLTEPAEKVLVAKLAPPHLRATAFGYFAFASAVAAFPASFIFGLVWQSYGVSAAFTLGATLAGLASIGLLFVAKTE